VLVGALVTAVIALVASVAVAVGTLGRTSGSSMMRGYDQRLGAGMMSGSMMGSMGMVWLHGDGVAVSGIPAARSVG